MPSQIEHVALEKGKEGQETKREEDEEPEQEEDEKMEREHQELGEEVGRRQSSILAASMMGTIILLSISFTMAQASNAKIRGNTLFVIDQVTAIFIAVLWFQFFDSLLDFHGIDGWHKCVAIALYTLAMLGVAVALAYVLRKSSVALAIVCGCLAHLISFASMNAGRTMQTHVFVAAIYSPAMALLSLVCLVVLLALVGLGIWHLKGALGARGEEEFMDQTDDLENDVGAMAAAFCFSLLVRFVLTGHHPSGGEVRMRHTSTQRSLMLAYGLVSLLAGAAGLVFLSRVRSACYPVKRLVMFANAFLSMNVAWAWLLWGEWEFYETQYHGDPIFGKLIFALVASLAAAGLTGAISYLPWGTGSVGVKSEEKVALVALGLVVAWSWESCFDNAVEALTEESMHPAPMKFATAAVLSAFLLPVYMWHLKPLVIQAQKVQESLDAQEAQAAKEAPESPEQAAP